MFSLSSILDARGAFVKSARLTFPVDEKALQRMAKRYESAKTERDAAIRRAHADGMTLRAIATVVGLSFQRVAQIVAASGPRG
jgi:hypothetical protein